MSTPQRGSHAKTSQVICCLIINISSLFARFILDGSERSGESKVSAAEVELTLENWERKTYLGVASLLAKACEAAMVCRL